MIDTVAQHILALPTWMALVLVAGVLGAVIGDSIGYLADRNWQHVEHLASRIGLGALAVVVRLTTDRHGLTESGGPSGSTPVPQQVAAQ